MDKTETNIKMCEKAMEIQQAWEPKAWDYCYCKVDNKVVVLSGYETDAGYYGHPTPCQIESDNWGGFYCSDIEELADYKRQHIFLPRQDQLQAIYRSFRNENTLSDDYAPLDSIEMAQDFNTWLETFTKKEPYSWFNNPADIRGWVQPSLERLWLAFVMKERYNKVWNGEDWVKAK